MATTKFRVDFYGNVFTFEFEGEPTWYDVDHKTARLVDENGNNVGDSFLEIVASGDVWAILHEPTRDGDIVTDKTTERRLMFEDGSSVNDLDSPEHGVTYIVEGELK